MQAASVCVAERPAGRAGERNNLDAARQELEDVSHEMKAKKQKRSCDLDKTRRWRLLLETRGFALFSSLDSEFRCGLFGWYLLVGWLMKIMPLHDDGFACTSGFACIASEPEHSISVRCVSDRPSETLNGGTQKAMEQKMMNWTEGDL